MANSRGGEKWGWGVDEALFAPRVEVDVQLLTTGVKLSQSRREMVVASSCKAALPCRRLFYGLRLVNSRVYYLKSLLSAAECVLAALLQWRARRDACLVLCILSRIAAVMMFSRYLIALSYCRRKMEVH